MSKFLLKLYIFLIIFQLYLFQSYNITNNITIPNITINISNSTNNNTIKRYQSTSMIQSIYTDSASNNYYYTILYIGRNLIRQAYLIDTDIDTLSSPCMSCFFCNRNKTNYYLYPIKKIKRIKCDSEICSNILPSIGCPNPYKSKQYDRCNFLSTKSNGDAMRGYFLKELVYFEDIRAQYNLSDNKTYRSRNIPIGCTKAEFGKYKNITVDGIMGLNNKKRSFVDILYKLKIIRRNLFSICLGHLGGYLALGGEMKDFRKGDNINYINLIKSDNSYLVKPTAIKLTYLTKNKIKVLGIIDSSTPITYFPNDLFAYIIGDFRNYFVNFRGKNKFKRFYYNEDYGVCTKFRNRKKMKTRIKLWPNIDIYFSKTKFRWKPNNYYYQVNQTTACLGINKHNLSHIIFGSNFMKEHDFIFDRRKKRIGFIKADCSKYISLRNNHEIFETYIKNEIDNETGIEMINSRTSVKNGIQYIRGRNNELDEFKNNSNLFKKIINIIYYSLILMTFAYIIIVLKKLCQYYDDDQGKLSFDAEEY